MESRADHRWSRMPRALLGRLHLIHISGLQSYLLPPVSAPRQAGLELLWVRTLGKFICLYQRSRSSSTTHTQYIWVKTGHSHNWRNTGKWEFTLTKQEFYPRSKEKKNWSEKCMYAEKTNKLSFAFCSWQKNAQLLSSFHYWQFNDNTNSACSSNNPWKLTIPTHSKSLWDLGVQARLHFPQSFSHVGHTTTIQ